MQFPIVWGLYTIGDDASFVKKCPSTGIQSGLLKLIGKKWPSNVFSSINIPASFQRGQDKFPGLPIVVVQPKDVVCQNLTVGDKKIPFLCTNIGGAWSTEVNSAQLLFWEVTADQAFDIRNNWNRISRTNYFKKGGAKSTFESADITDHPLPRGLLTLTWIPIENFVMVKVKTLRDLHSNEEWFLFFSEMLQFAFFGRFLSRTVF